MQTTKRLPSVKLLLPLLLIYSTLCAQSFVEAEEKLFSLYCPDFCNKGRIPEKCTVGGNNCSPELFWEGAPEKTKSFALVCKDLSDPSHKVHWMVYNIPASVDHLLADVGRAVSLPMGAFQGLNDFGKAGYEGPKAIADKLNHYRFTLYALDDILTLKPCCSYTELSRAMQPAELAHTSLNGYFQYQVKPQDLPPDSFAHPSDYQIELIIYE